MLTTVADAKTAPAKLRELPATAQALAKRLPPSMTEPPEDFEARLERDAHPGGDPAAATEQAEPCQAAAHLRRQRRFSHGA